MNSKSKTAVRKTQNFPLSELLFFLLAPSDYTAEKEKKIIDFLKGEDLSRANLDRRNACNEIINQFNYYFRDQLLAEQHLPLNKATCRDFVLHHSSSGHFPLRQFHQRCPPAKKPTFQQLAYQLDREEQRPLTLHDFSCRPYFV